MNNKKVKTYGLVLGVTLFVFLVAGFTYAALTWRSNNITINGSTECLDIDYTKGQDITGGNLLLLDKSKIISNNILVNFLYIFFVPPFVNNNSNNINACN